MRIKLFQIRLSREFYDPDQDNVNAFLEKVKVLNTSIEFVQGPPAFWSVLVIYNEKDPIPFTEAELLVHRKVLTELDILKES